MVPRAATPNGVAVAMVPIRPKIAQGGLRRVQYVEREKTACCEVASTRVLVDVRANGFELERALEGLVDRGIVGEPLTEAGGTLVRGDSAFEDGATGHG